MKPSSAVPRSQTDGTESQPAAPAAKRPRARKEAPPRAPPTRRAPARAPPPRRPNDELLTNPTPLAHIRPSRSEPTLPSISLFSATSSATSTAASASAAAASRTPACVAPYIPASAPPRVPIIINPARDVGLMRRFQITPPPPARPPAHAPAQAPAPARSPAVRSLTALQRPAPRQPLATLVTSQPKATSGDDAKLPVPYRDRSATESYRDRPTLTKAAMDYLLKRKMEREKQQQAAEEEQQRQAAEEQQRQAAEQQQQRQAAEESIAPAPKKRPQLPPLKMPPGYRRRGDYAAASVARPVRRTESTEQMDIVLPPTTMQAPLHDNRSSLRAQQVQQPRPPPAPPAAAPHLPESRKRKFKESTGHNYQQDFFTTYSAILNGCDLEAIKDELVMSYLPRVYVNVNTWSVDPYTDLVTLPLTPSLPGSREGKRHCILQIPEQMKRTIYQSRKVRTVSLMHTGVYLIILEFDPRETNEETPSPSEYAAIVSPASIAACS